MVWTKILSWLKLVLSRNLYVDWWLISKKIYKEIKFYPYIMLNDTWHTIIKSSRELISQENSNPNDVDIVSPHYDDQYSSLFVWL